MNILNYKENRTIKKDIVPLFKSAFPSNERPPVPMFLKSSLMEGSDLLAFYEENTFIGFTQLTYHNDVIYIYFLAVDDQQRNKGYGSQILKEVFALYPHYRFILCYDEIDDSYPDNEMRKRRRDFYYRNGFKDNELKVNEFGVRYDTVYYGKDKVKFEEYLDVFISNFGEFVKEHIKKLN